MSFSLWINFGLIYLFDFYIDFSGINSLRMNSGYPSDAIASVIIVYKNKIK